MMWENQQISEPYHLLFFDCPDFETFVFEKLRKKWSTMTSAIVDRIGLKKKKIQPKIIAHQYLPENKKLFESFDEIDINGVNPTGDTSLHLALNGEEWELAEEILNRFESYDVNITNSVGDTPLLLAARFQCEFGLFKKILNRTNSANVNKTNRNENTALHYAMFKKSETKVEELLKREDVDVDIKNRYDGSALHLASKWTNIQMESFNLILEKTRDVNSPSQGMGQNTALHYAIIHKSEITTKALLAHKDVDVNVKNDYNKTALHLASKWKKIPFDLFQRILEKSTDVINAQDNDRETALHYAIIQKSEIATKKWLKHSDLNVDIKKKDHATAVTALHLASKREEISSDLFNLILEKSTDINGQDNDGSAALHYAILGESEIATKELLKHEDMNVNMKNNKNVTSLHLASMWTNIAVDLFNLILEKSDDINSQDNDGSTALLWAIFLKSEIAVKGLLAHNDVDVNIKNNRNETALSYASKWKDIPMDLFQIILEKSTEINAQDINGDTALYWAIIRQSKIVTKILLVHKDVDVNVKNDNNDTALHWACFWWTDIPVDLFNLILEKSTDINSQNTNGNTALHFAILFKSEIATKALLAHNDVDVNVKNNNNEKALGYVSMWKDIPSDLFKLIKEKKANDVVKKILKMDRLSKYLRNLTVFK
jgi:ankyrin repeat protein